MNRQYFRKNKFKINQGKFLKIKKSNFMKKTYFLNNGIETPSMNKNYYYTFYVIKNSLNWA